VRLRGAVPVGVNFGLGIEPALQKAFT